MCVCFTVCVPWKSLEISLVLLPEKNNFHSPAENSVQNYLVWEWCTVHAGFPSGPRSIYKSRTPVFPKIHSYSHWKCSSTPWLSATASCRLQHPDNQASSLLRLPLAKGRAKYLPRSPPCCFIPSWKVTDCSHHCGTFLMSELSAEQHRSPEGPATAWPLPLMPFCPGSHLSSTFRRQSQLLVT